MSNKYAFLLSAYKKQFLYEAIKSIISQNYGNFSVLVSDDCSPEDLKSVVDTFNDSRSVYRRNEHNIGARRLVDHWNMLLNMTDSEFVIMASDDDVYHPDFLITIDELQCKFPNVDLLRARIQQIDDNGVVIWKERPIEEYQDPVEAVCECPDTCVANYVFRRKRLIEIGGFVDFPYAMGSDTVTAMSMSMNGVANTAQVLFSYRLSESQISCCIKDPITIKKDKLNGLFSVYDYCLEIVRGMPNDGSLYKSRLINAYIDCHKNALPHLTVKYASGLSIMQILKTFRELLKRDCFRRKLHMLEYLCSFISG